MADANKRINLAAPLLSVRRHGGGGGAEGTGVQSCTPDAAPGGVPFGWEHRPGHPKSVRTRRALPPPATARNEPEWDENAVIAAAAPVREVAQFSDALSMADSCLTVNCSSVASLSDAGPHHLEPAVARGVVMMDRFLPATHAVAVCSPQCTTRKTRTAATGATARTGHGDDGGLPRLLPPPHSPTSHALCIIPTEKSDDVGDEDDDEWDARITRGFASRKCGLLPTRCMKTTLLLLNPAPATRQRGGSWRRERGIPLFPKSGGGQSATIPLVRSTRNGQHLGHDLSMKSWEEVYINSLFRSGAGGRKGMGTMAAPELNRTTVRELYTDQGNRVVHHKASQLGFLVVLDRSDECRHDYHCTPAQSFPVSSETKPLPPPQTTRPATVINGGKKPRREAGGYGWPLLLEDKATAARRDILPLLPPLPLPSPTESWLSRALPSVSSKPPVTSFLGLHVQQRKLQAPSPWCSGGPAPKVADHRHAMPRRIRIHDLHKA
ncbi:hypothetical protein ABZP36_030628 [Zizania latifolia]